MEIDAREILFIRENAPKGIYRMVAENTGKSRGRVISELNRLKWDYDEKIIKEARRLLKVIKGLEYNPNN